MKKAFLLSLLIVLALVANAQDSTQAFKKHSLGINYSNDISSQFNTDVEYYISDKQRLTYGYAAALVYQYRPVQWFSVETGVEYNQSKTRVLDGLPYEATILQFLDDSPGDVDADFTRSISRFAVPLNLRFHYQKGRWGVYGLMGAVVTANHLREYQNGQNFYGSGESYNFLKENNIKEHLGLGLTAGVGVDYSITSRWLLRLEPRFRAYNVAKAKPDNYKLYQLDHPHNHYWSAGLNVGVYYGFGK